MIASKEIETAVISKLQTALASVSGVTVHGAWQSANVGDLANEQSADESVRISVVAGFPEYDTYTVPICSVPVGVGISVRRELAPNAAALTAVMGPIEDLLLDWQLDITNVSDLTTTHFRADGIRLDSGNPPRFDSGTNCWTIARSFTVRGVINNN